MLRQDVAGLYQGLSWVTYTSGAVLSAYTTGQLLERSGPKPVFVLAGAGLFVDSLCAFMLSEKPQGSRGAKSSAAGAAAAGHGALGAVAAATTWGDHTVATAPASLHSRANSSHNGDMVPNQHSFSFRASGGVGQALSKAGSAGVAVEETAPLIVASPGVWGY